MTSKVTIKHEGPNVNNILVTVVSSPGVNPVEKRTIEMEAGETTTIYIHDDQGLIVSEVPK